MTVRLTMAQALVRFLANQYVERDGTEQRFFAGCFGIFGHGNVAGVGQALLEYGDDLTYYQSRNEQAMVHTADRLRPPEEPPADHGVHVLHRPGRDQHGDGRGARDHKPPARPALARRRLRLARARPRAAAAGGAARRRPLGQRRLQAGLEVLGQGQPPRADHPRRPGRHARPDGPRRDRGRDARPAPGRPGRGLRLPRGVLREARLARRAPGARCGGDRARGRRSSGAPGGP